MTIIQPLHDLTAEQATLGAMLLNPGVVPIVASIISAGEFYDQRHQAIAQAIYECGDQADMVTVPERLRAAGRLDFCGGESYLGELVTDVPSASAVRYARIVSDRAERRRILSACSNIAKTVHDLQVEAVGIYGAAMDEFAKAARPTAHQSDPMPVVFEKTLTLFETRVDRAGQLLGYPSGVEDLDRQTAGWQRGRLVVIGGRPGAGKSVLAAQSALRAALVGAKVKYYTLEMSPSEVVLRMAKNRAQVGYQTGQEHALDDAKKGAVRKAIGEVSQLVDVRSTSSINAIIAECEIEHRRGALDMVVIDQLQNATPDIGRREAATRDLELSAATRALKQMALRLNISVLMCSAMNRANDGQKPTLANLRESGGIESDSDVACLLWMPDQEQPNVIEAVLAKNRDNPVCDVRMYFVKPMHRMADAARVQL